MEAILNIIGMPIKTNIFHNFGSSFYKLKESSFVNRMPKLLWTKSMKKINKRITIRAEGSEYKREKN